LFISIFKIFKIIRLSLKVYVYACYFKQTYIIQPRDLGYYLYILVLTIFLNQLKIVFYLEILPFYIYLSHFNILNRTISLPKWWAPTSRIDDSWWLLKQNPKLGCAGCEMSATEMRFRSDLRRHQMSQDGTQPPTRVTCTRRTLTIAAGSKHPDMEEYE